MHWQNFMFIKSVIKPVSARIPFILIAALLWLPSTAFGQAASSSASLSNDGILGCLGKGAQVANVGTLNALGGVFVPVNDAAVTVNTGFLVYKECVLDGVARKIAENATAETARQSIRAFSRSRGGGPQYLVEWSELEVRQKAIVVADLQKVGTSGMCEAFKRPVQNAIARSYLARYNDPQRVYACPFGNSTNDVEAFLRNQQFTYANWFSSIKVSGNAFGLAATLEANIEEDIKNDDRNVRQMLDWGKGVYSATDNALNPMEERVVTPGFLIAESIAQVTGSGFRQLESADEIDQVVANLWAGLTTQIVGSVRGLEGLTQSLNGQPSYVDRMVAGTRQGLVTSVSNTAIAVINGALPLETDYRAAKESIATALTRAIIRLQNAEKRCWELIVPAVQTYASQNGNPPLRIATTTDASKSIIDSEIAPLATTTLRDINDSNEALALLVELGQSVSGSASQINREQALVRLDTLAADDRIHSSAEVQQAVRQKDTVIDAVEKLVTDTIKAWGESTDPNIGWCNVSDGNPNKNAIIQKWFNAWKQ